VRRIATLLVLTAVTVGGATACGASKQIPNGAADVLSEGTRQVVMVSGRDDHGLVATENVVLHSAPEGGDVVGQLPDGTLAHVHEVRGTQVQVSAFGITGWVDDFALRGELRLAGPPPDCRVSLAGQDLPAGTPIEVLSLSQERAKVRLVNPPHTIGTVAASQIVEMAPLPGQSCATTGSGRTQPVH